MRRYMMGLIGIFVQVVVLSGCVSSNITYQSEINEDYKGLIKFSLKSSDITLSKKVGVPTTAKAPGADPILTSLATTLNIICGETVECFKDVQALVTPKEYSKDKLYAIVPQDNLWSTTNLSVSYVGETHLIKQIGSEVIDHRKEYIQAAGALLSTGMAVGILSSEKEQKSLNLPIVINVDAARGKTGWQPLGGKNEKWWFQLIVDSQKPAGTVEAGKFFSDYSNKTINVLGFSSCREATLYMEYGAIQPTTEIMNAPEKFRLTIVDPLHLETLRLPDKGNIKMHDLCGADIETQVSTVVSGTSLLKDAMDQVAAIKKVQQSAQQAAKAPGPSK